MRKIFFGQRDGSGGAILGFTEVDGAFFQVHLAARQGLDLAGTYTIKRLYISMTYRDARCLICITMQHCAGLIQAWSRTLFPMPAAQKTLNNSISEYRI
jgi:hypothetical protein